jgi:aminoglycoside 6'-N-acetyltransferase
MSRYEVPKPGDHEPIAGPHDVSFRPIVPGDLDDLWRWQHETEVVQWWGEPTEDREEFRRENFDSDVAPTWRFIIEWDGRGVGLIQYYHDYADTEDSWSAGIDIYIGEPDARDHGVGTEAVRTLLRYLFEVKHVHRVTIDPQTTNARAIRAYEKAGFSRDGVMRHNDFMHGRYIDTQYLSILEDEWPAAGERWLSERSAQER